MFEAGLSGSIVDALTTISLLQTHIVRELKSSFSFFYLPLVQKIVETRKLLILMTCSMLLSREIRQI